MTNLSHDSTRVGALDLEVSFQQGVPHLENLDNTRSLPGLLALDQQDFAHLDSGFPSRCEGLPWHQTSSSPAETSLVLSRTGLRHLSSTHFHITSYLLVY